jgi:uncharacterized membrane protein YbhN (UPF0104 family)
LKKTFKLLWPYVRVVLSLLLLWLAVRNIDWQALHSTKIEMQPQWFVLALALLVSANLLAVVRWGWLLRSLGLYHPVTNYITLYFAGGLINQGLPSIIGGDSYRAVEASRLAHNSETTTSSPPTLTQELHEPIDLQHAPPRLRLGFLSVAFDRGLGLVGNNILGALGLLLSGSLIAPWGPTLGAWVLGAMLGGAVVGCLLLKLPRTRSLILALLTKLGMGQALKGVDTAFGWPQVAVQLAISVMTHTLALCAFWFCLRAFGIDAPFAALMVGLPALGLLMMLPISISGWGLREATLSAALLLWGVDSGVTVLASVSFGIVTLVTYLPGAVSLLRRRRADALNTHKTGLATP